MSVRSFSLLIAVGPSMIRTGGAILAGGGRKREGARFHRNPNREENHRPEPSSRFRARANRACCDCPRLRRMSAHEWTGGNTGEYCMPFEFDFRWSWFASDALAAMQAIRPFPNYCTVSVNAVVCDNDPEVAVTVNVYDCGVCVPPPPVMVAPPPPQAIIPVPSVNPAIPSTTI